jgi:hypothetical protein
MRRKNSLKEKEKVLVKHYESLDLHKKLELIEEQQKFDFDSAISTLKQKIIDNSTWPKRI